MNEHRDDETTGRDPASGAGVPRRNLLAAASALGLAACASTTTPARSTATTTSSVSATPCPTSATPSPTAAGFVPGPALGDGSTSEQRPQPGRRTPARFDLAAAPPQYVVISWDGAGSLPSDQLTRFREVARRNRAHMTLFLSGIYFVPEARRTLYHPPAGHAPGSSAIGFLTESSVHRTIAGIGSAWLEGHEIGTHFNGHWCGPGGVGSWSSQDWRQEIEEAVRFVTTWRTTTGFTDLPRLPFDYHRELVGSRTPCLEGRASLLPVAKQLGWRYDSSGNGRQAWPHKLPQGLWDLSMPSIPFRGREVLSMDYNFMYQQSRENTKGDPARYAQWQAEAVDGLRRGLDRALSSNRAPLVVGNHFEQWNGGIYMNAVEQFMDYAGSHPEVQIVSMRELCDVLDAQDPAVLSRLQSLKVGQAPTGGWAEFLGPLAKRR